MRWNTASQVLRGSESSDRALSGGAPSVTNPDLSERAETSPTSPADPPGKIDSWLKLDRASLREQYAILDDRERPYVAGPETTKAEGSCPRGKSHLK